MTALQTIIGERRTYSEVGCSHTHPFAQLIVPLQGILFIETRTHQFGLDESSIFFVPPDCHHYFYADDTNEFLTLDIPAPLAPSLTGQGIRAEIETRWSAIRTLLLAEINEQRSPQAALSTHHAALLPLVNYIGTLLSQPSTAPSLRYIHQHYHRPLEVTQLAAIEGYSLTYYSEWFKTQTGKSPKTYIQDLRLQKAQNLLRYSDLPIYQIAQQVGFQQASSLTRLFQRRQGQSPQQYRTNPNT